MDPSPFILMRYYTQLVIDRAAAERGAEAGSESQSGTLLAERKRARRILITDL